jgi:hypothetical protein
LGRAIKSNIGIRIVYRIDEGTTLKTVGWNTKAEDNIKPVVVVKVALGGLSLD